MKYSDAEIEEARRLAEQAQAQVDTQAEVIARMQRSGLSTAITEEALRTMSRIRDQMRARLKSMTEASKGS